MLDKLGIPHEVKVVSAHRTPDLLFQYAEEAEARGIQVIIAGAGGAAHLPGMCAAKTHLPVLGVPVQSSMLSGVDSLLSIVQMPAGVPVATLAIGKAGAVNAALLAASILGHQHPQFHTALKQFRQEQTDTVLSNPPARGLKPIPSELRHGAFERCPLLGMLIYRRKLHFLRCGQRSNAWSRHLLKRGFVMKIGVIGGGSSAA